MNQDLIKNNYLLLKNFISPDQAKELARRYKNLQRNIGFGDDEHVSNAPSWSNCEDQLALLCNLCPRISEICGESVLPTYAFGRIYQKGSELERHSDRAACEISLTLHLEGDKEWDFCIETPYYEQHCVKLEPGDAIMYLGVIADHWRDGKYTGESYTQFFLHYVRVTGWCRDAYFDRNPDLYKDVDSLTKSNILKKEYYELR
tara:strand:+ start:258 stop:866 length:609 start_codon:yes stop_codon:yes gene_type:complete